MTSFGVIVLGKIKLIIMSHHILNEIGLLNKLLIIITCWFVIGCNVNHRKIYKQAIEIITKEGAICTKDGDCFKFSRDDFWVLNKYSIPLIFNRFTYSKINFLDAKKLPTWVDSISIMNYLSSTDTLDIESLIGGRKKLKNKNIKFDLAERKHFFTRRHIFLSKPYYRENKEVLLVGFIEDIKIRCTWIITFIIRKKQLPIINTELVIGLFRVDEKETNDFEEFLKNQSR